MVGLRGVHVWCGFGWVVLVVMVQGCGCVGVSRVSEGENTDHTEISITTATQQLSGQVIMVSCGKECGR